MCQPINCLPKSMSPHPQLGKSSQNGKWGKASCFSRCLSQISDKIYGVWTSLLNTFYPKHQEEQPTPLYYSTKMITGKPEHHRKTLDKILKGNGEGKGLFNKDNVGRNQEQRKQLNMEISFNDETKTVSLARNTETSSNNSPSPMEGFTEKCDSWLDKKCAILNEKDRKIVADLISGIFSQYGSGSFAVPIAQDLSRRENKNFTPSSTVNVYDFDYNVTVSKDENKGVTLQVQVISKNTINIPTIEQTMNYATKKEKYDETPFLKSLFIAAPKHSFTHAILPGSVNRLSYHLGKDKNNKTTLSVVDEKLFYRLHKVAE